MCGLLSFVRAERLARTVEALESELKQERLRSAALLFEVERLNALLSIVLIELYVIFGSITANLSLG